MGKHDKRVVIKYLHVYAWKIYFVGRHLRVMKMSLMPKMASLNGWMKSSVWTVLKHLNIAMTNVLHLMESMLRDCKANVIAVYCLYVFFSLLIDQPSYFGNIWPLPLIPRANF